MLSLSLPSVSHQSFRSVSISRLGSSSSPAFHFRLQQFVGRPSVVTVRLRTLFNWLFFFSCLELIMSSFVVLQPHLQPVDYFCELWISTAKELHLIMWCVDIWSAALDEMFRFCSSFVSGFWVVFGVLRWLVSLFLLWSFSRGCGGATTAVAGQSHTCC